MQVKQRGQNTSTCKGAGSEIGSMGGKKRGGPGGYCVCPGCGERVIHQRGIPCYSLKCPKCCATMMRE